MARLLGGGFQALDKGLGPAEVARGVGNSLKTACTYLYQWKRLPKHLEVIYIIMKRALQRSLVLAKR